MSTATPDEPDIQKLRDDFSQKHRECERAAYALFCASPIGRDRIAASNLYEIIRTAPREARQP